MQFKKKVWDVVLKQVIKDEIEEIHQTSDSIIEIYLYWQCWGADELDEFWSSLLEMNVIAICMGEVSHFYV